MPFKIGWSTVANMTRETKLGLLVSCSFLCLLGVVLGVEFNKNPTEQSVAINQDSVVPGEGPKEKSHPLSPPDDDTLPLPCEIISSQHSTGPNLSPGTLDNQLTEKATDIIKRTSGTNPPTNQNSTGDKPVSGGPPSPGKEPQPELLPNPSIIEPGKPVPPSGQKIGPALPRDKLLPPNPTPGTRKESLVETTPTIPLVSPQPGTKPVSAENKPPTQPKNPGLNRNVLAKQTPVEACTFFQHS